MNGSQCIQTARCIGGFILWHLLALLICVGCLRAAESDDMAFVLKVLKTPPHDDKHDDRYKEHAKDLERLGDSALPLLARYLHEWDFTGDTALFTMLAIDADKAAPFIFASLPDGVHEHVQEWAFRMYNQRLLKGEVVPNTNDIHAAAVRCLDPSNKEIAPIETLYAVGLTGSREDWPLLERCYKLYLDRAEKAENVPSADYRRKVAGVAEAALARLGHPTYLDNIEAKLKKPVELPAESETLVNWIEEAGFSGNERFVPLLCKHLHDTPTPPSVGGFDIVIHASPDASAADALGQILKHKLPNEGMTEKEFEEWKAWCAQKKP